MRHDIHPAVPWHRAHPLTAAPRPRLWSGQSPLSALADAAEEEHELAAVVLRRAAAILAEQSRPQLHRLVYVSRTAWGAESSEARAAAILLVAQRRNAELGITGALLHSDEWFGQVLEGGMAGIEATFGRIDRDFRHSDIRVLCCEAILEREFASFAMAEAGPAPDAMLHAAAATHARDGQNGCTSHHTMNHAATEIVHVMHQHLAAG